MEINSTPVTRRPVSNPPWYYRLIISLLKPLYRLQVWRRSHKRDNYQQEVAQRFGKHYPPRPVTQAKANRKIIWCHAVSLGETNTIAPLLDKLLQQEYQIWLTNTTQTGFTRGASRFAEAIVQERMSHSYVPVDTPAVIKTFLAHVQPVAAMFVETELWANTLTVLAQQNIPSILVNGRLSAASFNRYQKISAVSASMMQNLTLIIAQDDESAERFQQLGAHSSQVQVTGSLKWVINAPKITHSNDDNLKQKKDQDTAEKNAIILNQQALNEQPTDIELRHLKRPIWVAASTHSGEEDIVLSLQQQLLAIPELSDTLLIIVPRHPERFDEVAVLIKKLGLNMARRSSKENVTAQTQVYLADSMGELMTWFALADVALVGGSLTDIGGHNPVEPASVATPILMGRYTQSCQTVVDKLAGVGALYQPHNDFYRPIATVKPFAEHDKAELIAQAAGVDGGVNASVDANDNALIYNQLQFWLSHLPLANQAGQAGAELAEQQQTVLTRQLMMIEEVIAQFANSNQ
ncbi:3-deoxy-D-manno-octulosonic acid transferase [Psychrobacter frigidicola]|uniref:3-deoxy-D-manno-octulosonic acid transferase n=1 Tax=Psychrobacter frigidicola TaxID=45611 RepID=A0A5C7ABP9_9GAMM|nr:3-deoxy-D-manno-octulosonic acid transferase [Psychrobacter frigidicola]TXD98273.1 3-deoxy-D-manno-octulosonic acid transferase [Psychrobacter frigidicola]